jgi:hypothetical protein
LLPIVTTFKRHGYYCRSKKPGHNVSKKRACIPCSLAKVRCDWKLSRCSNCKTKNIKCQYTDEAIRNLLANMPTVSESIDGPDGSLALLESTTDLNSVPSPNNSFDLNSNLDIFLDNGNLSGSAFANTLDLDPQSSSALPLSLLTTPDFSTGYTLNYPPSALTRSMMRRRLGRPQMLTQATLIIQILASFPAMVLRKETFPPFIHSHSFSAITNTEYNMPEALINCMSLAQLFKTRTKENSPFLWKNIRMEHERLWCEVSSVPSYHITVILR